jgi:ParB/RepB/Spo0J family partition protein
MEDMEIQYLPASRINTNTNRREAGQGDIGALVASIGKVGLINPITVKKAAKGYDIVTGRRRFSACRELGWTLIPCIVTEGDAETLALVENSARLEMDPLDEGIYFASELKKGTPIQELCERSCRSKSQVFQRAKLAGLIPELRVAWKEGRMKLYVAALASELPEEEQKRLANIHGELSEWTVRGMRPITMDPLGKLEGSCEKCGTCTRRTMHTDTSLFPELNNFEEDYCLDHTCFLARQKKLVRDKYDKYFESGMDSGELDEAPDILCRGSLPGGLTLYGGKGQPIDSDTILFDKIPEGAPEDLFRKVTL